ncbi:MAG: hypothetical protein ACRDRQ_03205, partial [Pseudonocardiaceae bacterium]
RRSAHRSASDDEGRVDYSERRWRLRHSAGAVLQDAGRQRRVATGIRQRRMIRRSATWHTQR